MHKRHILYITIIALAAFITGICPGLAVAVSSQEIPSYSILLEFDKDLYYTGETAYFDIRLVNGQEPVGLDSLEVEAVLLQEEKALPLKEYKGGRGTFSCILEANEENPAIEVTVYRKNRQERTRALLARKAKFLKDIERLRDSRWFLFWKREKIEREIDQLGKTVEKIESSVEQLNAPLAKASKSVVVLSRPAILLNAADEEKIKETEMVVISFDDADSPPDTSESFSPAPPGSHDFAEGPLEKTAEIVPEKPRTSGPPEVVKKLFQAGAVTMPPQKQEKIIPKEGISRKEGSETLAASTPPAAYIPPFYSRVKDTIPPVTSSDYKKSGIVTNEDVRITLQAADNAKGVEKTFYRINGGSWKGYDRPITDFANGEHVVEYYSIDKDGNKEDPPNSVTVRIDRAPPALTVSYPSSTQENTIALNGTVSEDTGVLTMDGHQVLLKGGTFSIAHVSLPARKNVFRFEAIDQAGNKTVRDVAIECLWDKTAPSVAIKGIEHGAFYPKTVTPVVSVDDAQSKVTMSMVLNGETFLSGTPISKDGKYTLSVEAVDAYENHAGISVSFSVDRTAPETKDDYRKTDAWSHDDAKIVLLAADTGAGVESIYYRIGGGAFAAYQSPIEIQEEGIRRIQYYAQDRLGNKESFKTTTVKIDKTPPAIDLKAEELTVEAADILTPVNFSSPDVKDNLDNAVRLSSEHLSKQGYPLGTTQVLYRAVDHAGNSSSAVTNVRIQDSTAPRISLDFPRDNSYAAHTVNVSGRCEEIFLKHLLINGEKVDVVDGQFARTIPVAGDKFEVEVKAADTSGNEGAVSRTVLRDILPPETGHDYAHDGVWTRENARITLSALDDGSGAKTTYFREENEPFLEYRRPIDIRKEGKYKVEYYSIDEVGNEEARRNVSVWIDQTPPALKITSPRDGAYVSGGTVEVRGTAGDAFLSRVLVNGRPATVSSGNFVSTVPLEGEKIILTAEAFDELGHQNSDSVNVILDASLPVTTDDYAFDNVWGNQDARIHLAAADAGSGIQATYYRIYAEGTNPPAFVSCNPGDVIIIDQEGKWTVEYYSMDQVEGRESPHFISVLLDKTAPVTADNHGGHVDPTNKDVVIVFAATDAGSGVEAIYYRLDKASFAPVTGPITVSQDGTHVLEYYALDRAGNEEARKTLEIPVDKIPPQITVDSPADGSTIEENTVVIKGAVSGDTVALTLNGQSVPLLNSTFLVNNFKLTPGENKITLIAQDGVGNQTTLEITVAKVNRPPVLDPVSDITVNEGQAVNFHPTGSDPDGDSVTFSYSGWMTSASYTTTHDDAGAHTVTVTASDGDLTASRDVRVTVNNVNRPPVLDSVADVFVNEGETVNLNPAAGDPDGDSVIFSYSGWMTSSSHVTTYDDAGQRTVTVTVSDGNLTDSQNVTVIVSNVNRPPGADTKKVLLNEDTPTGIVLTGSDPDQNSLNYALVSAPVHGVLSGGAPQLVYTPNKDYNGPDAFTFKVNDGSVDSGAATADLLVQPVNDAPALAAVGNKSVEENAHLEFAVTAADAEGDVLTITAASLKSWMSFDGTVFAADPGFGDSGNYAVTFTVSDGTLTDTEAVIISVGDVNRPPQLALIGDRGADEGGSLQFVLSAGDPDGDTLHFAASNLPAGSNFNADTRTFTWQPGYDQAGVFSGVHFEADDGEFSDSEDIVITVHNVNRAPVLNPMADMTVDEGATVVLNPTAVDPDGDSIDFTYFGWMNFAERVTGYEDTGVHTVSVTASDGYLTDSQDVTVTVNNVNRAPVLDPVSDITVNEGQAVNFHPIGSDPDGDSVTFSYSGWMTSASYTTTHDDAGAHTVTVTASDGQLTDFQDVTVTVKNVNRAPVLNQIADISVHEGAAASFNPTASDPDGDNLTFIYSGWMTSSSYTTNYADAGQHTVTVTVTDGELTDAQDVKIIVNNTNRAPVLNPIADITVNEGETVILNAAGSDPDGDSVTLAYAGWMSSASRTTGYTDAGVHTVTVTISDGMLSDAQDVTVTVSNVNRAPVLDFIFDLAVYEGETITFKPTASDPDGDALTFTYSGWMSSSGHAVTRDDGGIHTVAVSVSDGQDTDSQDVIVTVEVCGDGIKNGPEICDEGTDNGTPNHCNAQCAGTTAGVCGNNIKESGEACDDGNKVSGDGCSTSCVKEYCGDNIVQTGLGETCEGNSIKSCVVGGYAGVQSCTNCIDSSCVPGESCGDGTIQTAAGEVCDDGNITSEDGCSAACKLESCGDGIVQSGLGEQCDDGNALAGDGCNAGCQNEYCGDGIIQTDSGEVCDSNARACTTSAGYSGMQNCGIQCIGFNACTTNLFCGDGVCSNPPETTISCPSDCPAICGNGIAEPSEECDDRNTTSGDGCSATCKLEICGDGIVQTGHGEQCDDGNTANGDGCSSTCQREQVVDTTPPSMPAGLSCSVISTSQINLSWSASSDNVGVTGYRVYRNSSQVATAANTAYQNTGLNPATTYTYNVAAYDAAGNVSNQSSAVQCTTQNPPDTTAPAVSVTSPLNNASVSGTTTVSATASDNVEIAGVQFKLDGVTLQTEDTASPYSINWNTATAPNGAHTLTATARDTAGNTANSSTVTVTVNNLVTPGDSILTNPGFESGTSPWFFYTNGAGTFNADAAGEASAHAGHVVISQAGTNVQLYQANLTLEPNASYRLTFKAYSNTGHDISVSLQKHGSPYTVYGLSGRVFDLTSSWGQFSVQFTTAGFSNTVNDGRLMFWLAPYASGADEYFIDDVVLEKVISADQEDTTPPSMPSGLTATAVSSSQINLGWSASSDNAGVAGYRVFRNNIQVAASTTASYSSTGLSANTNYAFTVSAYDAAGNESAESTPVSATTHPAMDTTAPSVPTGLTATAVSASQINLVWTASTDNVGVPGYKVFRDGTQIGTSGTTSYQSTGLLPNTTYSFTVSAFDAAGNTSARCAPVVARTQTDGGGGYGKPAGYFESTPFPVDETLSSYSITNDEGTKTRYLGAVYFVDGTLSGTCSGLYDPLARTCGEGSYTAYKTIAGAMGAVTAGNKTILVRSGIYNEYELYTKDGTSDTNRYSIIGYKQERPTIDGTGSGLYSHVIWGKSYVTLQRLEIKNGYDGAVRASGNYNNFIDLYVHDINAASGEAGIHIENSDYGWVYHSTVSRTKNHGYKVADNSDYGIVEWSIAEYIGYWNPEGDVHFRHAIAFDFVSHEQSSQKGINNTLRYSRARDTYSYAINMEHQDNPSVHHNEVYNAFRVYDVNPSAAAWVSDSTQGAYSVDLNESPRGSFYGNVIHDKRGAYEFGNDHGHLQFWSDTAQIGAGIWNIHNNLFYDSGVPNAVEHFIQIQGNFQSGSTVNIYNNTIYGDTNGGDDTLIAKSSWSGTLNVKNNILYQAGTGSVFQGSPAADYNLYYYPSGSLGATPGSNDINNSNPLFIQIPSGSYDNNDGYIQSNSPAKDVGTDLSGFFTEDISLVSRPQGPAWDIGAHEYAADTTYDVPSDRRIDWSPGIPGGTPTNHNLCANVKNSPYNAVGDGLADDTAAFQSALAACPSGTYVYVPSGIYKLTTGLTIPGGVLLKGDGPALSKLRDYQPAGSYFVQMNGQSSSVTANITAGYAKDSTQITVDSATGLNVNDYIMISQLNEAGLATDRGYGNTCTWCGPRDLNERAMAQIVKVTAINGNDLTLNRPVYYASAGYSPQAMKLGSSVRINSGIQDLYLERVNTAGSGYNIIFMQFCVNCRVKNVETYKTGGAHIRMSYTYGNEIRDNYFHEAWGYGSGAGYGILMIHTNSDNLIENNIFNLTRHSVVMEGGGSGNVVAYNYSKDPYDSDSPTWLSGDMITHGAHPYMNLFEGNYAANFENDNTWGSSSHNTYFRNHANRSRSITTALAQRAIDVQANNHYMNYVGNVLGPATGGGTEGPGTNCGTQPIDWRAQGCNTPSGTENPPTDSTVAPTILRHGNYSYASGNTQWDPSMSNHNLPASYYLLSKPSFFGDLPWPGIGPDLNPVVGVLPAKARFDAL